MPNRDPRSAANRTEDSRFAGGDRGLLLIAVLLICGHGAGAAAPAATARTSSAAEPVAAVRPGHCASLAREPYAAPVFLGYACRDRECTAHKSGFAWAERNAIADAKECAASPNPAFVEGCRAFVEESVTPEQAGFVWARENELDEPCRCRGGGPGFEAGCTAYVQEGER